MAAHGSFPCQCRVPYLGSALGSVSLCDGRRTTDKVPLITQESMVIGQRFGQSIGAEIRGRIVEELRKRGHDI
jgi:hypothetical protein